MKHLYIGDGKGKTTAAVGLAVRCAGSGKRVLMTQFLKSGSSGELESLKDMDNMQLLLCPAHFGFTWNMSEDEKTEAAMVYERYLWDITRIVIQGNFDMLIMDEVLDAIRTGLLDEDALCDSFDQFPDELEIVLTGREPSERMMAWADYITEMKKIRHPYDQGVKARKGIEY